MLHCLPRRILCCLLRSEGSALPAALEIPRASRRPSDTVALNVCDRDDRVVEGRLDVRDPRLDILPDLLTRLIARVPRHT